MRRIVAVHDSDAGKDVEMRAFSEYGAFFGIQYDDRNRPYVVSAGMLDNGNPDNIVAEVSNAGDTPKEAQKWVDSINGEFGTRFVPRDFFGR